MQYDEVINTKMTYKNKKMIVCALGGIFVFLWIFSYSHSALASEITAENIVKVVNAERQARYLEPLNANSKLENAAKNKSIDMIVKNYFEHYANGRTPWSFIRNEDYEYSIAGENLAMGYSTAEGVVNAWMNSPTHRANILNPEYEDIGVGVVKGAYFEDGKVVDTTITTEMFAKPKPRIVQMIDTAFETISKIFK